jgi:hypothetical protein
MSWMSNGEEKKPIQNLDGSYVKWKLAIHIVARYTWLKKLIS